MEEKFRKVTEASYTWKKYYVSFSVEVDQPGGQVPEGRSEEARWGEVVQNPGGVWFRRSDQRHAEGQVEDVKETRKGLKLWTQRSKFARIPGILMF